MSHDGTITIARASEREAPPIDTLGVDDRVYVLDLASAVWFRPGGWAWRRFFRWLRKPDVAALLKWKRVLGAGDYTEEEQSFLRRYGFWRSLWIFNRK